MTSYNGENIVYDAIGNPLEYRGWEFEWSRGRRLDKVSKPGYNINISFKYDENGIRTRKIVNGIQTDFVTSGIKVLAQKSGNNTLVWQIDGNGNTVGFNYNGISYFYMKNLQGDIIGITDTSGNIVAKYTYDSWGNLISIKDSNGADRTTDTTFIGYINPIRYRGYYYDSETGLYYLNARYYDPEVGRFINADDYEILFEENEDLLRYNIFIYCSNNPIMGYDPTGNVKYMNPMDIRFSQDSIRAEFGDNSGRTIFDTIRQLKEGTATADTIPAIKVLKSDFIIDNYAELGLEWYMVKYLRRGLTFTLDNRRLYAFQQAHMQQIRVEDATRKEIIEASGKFSTLIKDFARKKYKFGIYIRLRD